MFVCYNATPWTCDCLCLAAAMLCLAPYFEWIDGPALITFANAANALQLQLPPKPERPVSPVLWVLRQAVGNLRQPWDSTASGWEPPTRLRWPLTHVHGMIFDQ